MRNRHPLPHVVLLMVVALLLSACASADDAASVEDPVEGTVEPTDATPGDSTPTPTDDADGMERPEPDMTADVRLPATGTLGLSEVEGGCVFVEIDGDRYELLADTGADVAVDPANGVIADAAGEVIARAGEEITVDGTVDPGIVTFCQIGPVLVADSITAG